MSAPAIGVRNRWRPDVHADIDYSHPLAARLVACHYPVSGVGAFDLVGGSFLPLSNVPGHRAGRWGYEMLNDDINEGAALVIGSTHKLSLQPPFTWMWVGTRIAAAPSGSRFYGATYDDADSEPWSSYNMPQNETTNCDLYGDGNDGGSYSNCGPSTGVTLGPHVFVGLRTTSMSIWVDGKQGPNVTSPGGTVSYGGTATFGITMQPAASRATNAGTALGAVWSRALSDGEIATVSSDPFCFLRR